MQWVQVHVQTFANIDRSFLPNKDVFIVGNVLYWQSICPACTLEAFVWLVLLTAYSGLPAFGKAGLGSRFKPEAKTLSREKHWDAWSSIHCLECWTLLHTLHIYIYLPAATLPNYMSLYNIQISILYTDSYTGIPATAAAGSHCNTSSSSRGKQLSSEL